MTRSDGLKQSVNEFISLIRTRAMDTLADSEIHYGFICKPHLNSRQNSGVYHYILYSLAVFSILKL